MTNPYEPPKTKETAREAARESIHLMNNRRLVSLLALVSLPFIISLVILLKFPSLDGSNVYLCCLGGLVLIILFFKLCLKILKRTQR